MDSKTQMPGIWAEVLEPMCEGTEKLLKPIAFGPNDRLSVRLVGEGRHFALRAYSLHNNIVGLASWACQKFFERLPEKEHTPGGGYTVAATDLTAVLIYALWPAGALDLDEESAQVLQYLLARFTRQTIGVRDRAAWKLTKTLPAAPFDFVDHPEYPLAPYQRAGLFTSMNDEGFALFMEQGTGKTAIVIRRMCMLANRIFNAEKRMMRVLIVCPKNVRANWENEIAKFSTSVGKIATMRGGALDRIKTLIDGIRPEPDCEWVAIVTSYETLRRSWDILKNPWEGKSQWDLIVLDESHYIKGSYAKRSNLCVQLRNHSDKRMILTGTPVCNGVRDLYMQLEFLGDGMSGFIDEDEFRKFYVRYAENDDGHEVAIGEKNLPFLRERLARVSFSITKKEALPELPEKLYEILEIEMTAQQRKAYVELAEQLALEIENDLVKNAGLNETVTVNNVLVKLLRLAQVTSGFIAIDNQYTDSGLKLTEDRIRRFDRNPKIEALLERIKNSDEKSKFIVWATFVPDITEIVAQLTLAGIKCVSFYGATNDKDRDAAVETFNKDASVKVFVGNPVAGGTGINLWGYMPEWEGTERDHGCNADHVVYFSQNWSMPARSQSEDRCHRRGTRVPITYIDLVAPGTIDEEIRARVIGKRNTASKVQDVRGIMEAVLSRFSAMGDD